MSSRPARRLPFDMMVDPLNGQISNEGPVLARSIWRGRRHGCAAPPPVKKGAIRRLAAWCSYQARSEEHTSELQSLMRISYAVFCLKKNKKHKKNTYQLTYSIITP